MPKGKGPVPKDCECMCHMCGRGDKYYKGCHCAHACCRPIREQQDG